MSEPDRSHYMVEASVLHQVGPAPAVVHAILVANETDGVTQMTHKQVANTAGISTIKVRRSIDQLREAGLLKPEPQFHHNRVNLRHLAIAKGRVT